MKSLRITFFLSCLCSASAFSPVANVGARAHQELNGKWAYIIDPYDTGYYDYRSEPYDRSDPPKGGYGLDRRPEKESDLVEYAFVDTDMLWVPRDWNSQRERLLYYEGSIWYRKKFDAPNRIPGHRQFLHFGGANYEASVFLNARTLGRHVGGFTPFGFEVTSLLRDKDNSVVVRVNNQRKREGVPTLNTDWWNYGGLTRDVNLVDVPETFISDYRIELLRGEGNRIHVTVQLDGKQAAQKVHVLLPDLQADQVVETNADGFGEATFAIDHLERWSPETPKLYAVTFAGETDRVSDEVGFRTIETRGHEILLNGKPIFLRGVSIHEENPLKGGRAATIEDARLLLGWAKELHCNFARLAHYPHNEYMARLADHLGILLWEEIPVYWTIQWENPETLQNARQQLGELIQRDHNRASVIVWSVANETPVGEARTHFLKTLVDDARRLDGTRLVSAAMEVRRDPSDPTLRIVDDPFGEFTDLQSFNEYVGWYDGLPENCERVKWRIARDKPVFISECGGGALAGLHGSVTQRFTEEFQAEVYRHTLPMLRQLPGFSGMTPWCLMDFRSPRRPLPGIQDGWNRKGLFGENGAKKEAFFILRSFYEEMEAAAKTER